MTWLPNARRSTLGSRLGRARENRPEPGSTFLCGVRVISGQVEGESGRWRFRSSAADELVQDDVVTLHHGVRVQLRLRRLGTDVAAGKRPHHLLLLATEIDSGAEVQLSLPTGEVHRFGVVRN